MAAFLFPLFSLVVSCSAAVEQWGQWEGAWTIPASSLALSNPFDVELLVDLTPLHVDLTPTTRGATSATSAAAVVVVRGFFDGVVTKAVTTTSSTAAGTGHLVFKARFMPPSQGTWRYETRCKDAPGLSSRSGTFTVVAPTSNTNNRGPVVRSSKSPTRLAYADGSGDFHVVGTTVYGLAVPNSTTTEACDARTAATIDTLKSSPFNKVRMMAYPFSDVTAPGPAASFLPYEPVQEPGNSTHTGRRLDLARFNLVYWRRLERAVQSLMEIDVQADVILFDLYTQAFPLGLGCLGGPNSSTYDLGPDTRFIQFAVARLASFRNVWWSLSNEWNQCACKWDGRLANSSSSSSRSTDFPVPLTPIWDALFRAVAAEDPSHHLMSVHNNAVLYNYSQPWITHFSIQHTHFRPGALWQQYGRDKPFVWDEVKYEGNVVSNWGSLSAAQMVHRSWWGLAVGAAGTTHGEVLTLHTAACEFGRDSWSGNGGRLCGESPPRIAWFKDYVATRVPVPLDQCAGDDDGYVQTLRCGSTNGSDGDAFIMFRFYNCRSAFCAGTFSNVSLPAGVSYRQERVEPWAMRVDNIWPPQEAEEPTEPEESEEPKERQEDDDDEEEEEQEEQNFIGGGSGGSGGGGGEEGGGGGRVVVGITVDEDSLPHILTFTRLKK